MQISTGTVGSTCVNSKGGRRLLTNTPGCFCRRLPSRRTRIRGSLCCPIGSQPVTLPAQQTAFHCLLRLSASFLRPVTLPGNVIPGNEIPLFPKSTSTLELNSATAGFFMKAALRHGSWNTCTPGFDKRPGPSGFDLTERQIPRVIGERQKDMASRF